MVGVQFQSFRGCVLASWVIGANMECKLFVALQLEVRTISSKDVPVSELEGLNRQSHSEQPKPRRGRCSIHTSFRLMAYVAAPQHCLDRMPGAPCRQGTKRSPFAAA
jgi:hypothetical protein